MNNLKSKFNDDMNGEKILANFLDKFLYKKLDVKEFCRNNDLEKQFRGIDVVFVFKGKEFIIDEKAQLHYPVPRPTFAFELCFRKADKWKMGWFYDETKRTEYYLLAWPKRKEVEVSELIENDIHTVEVMLINRQKLRDYLFHTYKINKESIKTEIEKIIKANEFGPHPKNHSNIEHYYYYTNTLAETPINLIIKKNRLKKLAEFYFTVYRNKPFSKEEDYSFWLKERFQTSKNK